MESDGIIVVVGVWGSPLYLGHLLNQLCSCTNFLMQASGTCLNDFQCLMVNVLWVFVQWYGQQGLRRIADARVMH